MADTIKYFGNPVPATYPNGDPVIVNGRPLLIPQNFDLQTQFNAASFKSTQNWLDLYGWFLQHYPPGGSGDPQRQAGISGGFDPRYTTLATTDMVSARRLRASVWTRPFGWHLQ